jgi:peptide/nickel transport system substrate-binding protein
LPHKIAVFTVRTVGSLSSLLLIEEEKPMESSKLLAVLTALAVMVAACGSGDGEGPTTTTGGAEGATTTEGPTGTTAEPTGGSEAGEGGNLLLLQWQAPSQANAYLSTGTKDLLASSLTLEPLAEYDPDGNIVRALAADIPTIENGGISEDQTQITWTLQEGILWSDGAPLTADDVVFSWEYCSDPPTGCVAQTFTNVIDVEAVDDLTVTVTFDGPTPYPFVPFVGFNSPIIQRAQFADCVGEAAKTCTEENFAPIGTGPYVVTDLRPEDSVSYELNPNYRGVPDGKPFFGSVEVKGGGDAEATARSVLEIGEADYAWNLQVAPEILSPMEAAGNGSVLVSFNSSVEHINLNQTDPNGDPPSEYQGEPTSPTGGTNPFFYQNTVLHDALSLAINRDEIVAVGYGAAGVPTCNIWPVGEQDSPNNDDVCTQDVDAANDLLDEAGYIDSDGDGVRETPDGTPLEFDFVTSTNAVRQATQDLVAVYWEQIGVQANMSNEDGGVFFDGTCASDACIWKFFTDIQMFTNGSTGPDAQGYFLGWTCAQIPASETNYGGGNVVRLCDQEFDALFAELSAAALDDPARDEIVIAMNDIIVDYSTIPLVNRGTVSAFSNAIQGVGTLNGWDSEYWNVEEWTRN